MIWRLGYSTALGRVEGYAVFLRAVVMRLSLSATLLPPPAAARGRKKERASRTRDRRERRELNAAVLTVAAYTEPWRKHTRSHTSPAPWWPSVCGWWRPRRAGRRARTSSPRSLGGTWDRGERKRVFKTKHRSPQKGPHLHTYTHAGVSSKVRNRQVPWKQKCRWESGHSAKWDQTAAATNSGGF